MTQQRAIRHPHPLPQMLLARLSTHRLLQILKVARKAWHGLWVLGTYPDTYVPRQPRESVTAHQERVAKVEAEWERRKAEIEAYETSIKQVLATREHIPRETNPNNTKGSTQRGISNGPQR